MRLNEGVVEEVGQPQAACTDKGDRRKQTQNTKGSRVCTVVCQVSAGLICRDDWSLLS